MRKIHLVLDLALLQGSDREARLQQLATSISRIWATYHNEDFSWGYTLYDSSIGNVLFVAKLRRTAGFLKIPKHFQEASSGDLPVSDLINYLTLVDKVTDAHVQALSAGGTQRQRASRSSQKQQDAVVDASSESLSQRLTNALQTALSSSFLQKLATAAGEASLSDSGQPSQGVLAIFTSLPSPGDALPPSIMDRCTAARLHVSLVVTGQHETLLPVHPPAVIIPLHVAASDLTFPAFVALLGLPVLASDVAQSKEAMVVDVLNGEEEVDAWPGADTDLDGVKVLMGVWERATGRATDDIKRNARERHRRAQTALRNKQPAVAPTNRRSALRSKAKDALRAGLPSAAATHTQGTENAGAAAAGTTAMKKANDDEASSIHPMTLEDALARLSLGVSDAASMGCESVAGKATNRMVTDRIAGLVQTTFTAVTRHIQEVEGGSVTPAFLNDVRTAILTQAALPLDTVKAQYKTCDMSQLQQFAWTCMSQVLLRLSAVVYNAVGEVSLPAGIMSEITTLMQLVAATLKPVPVGGRRFFVDVVKPRYAPLIGTDIHQLELSLWDEDDGDDDEEDEDGQGEGSGEAGADGDVLMKEGVTTTRPGSLEISGETSPTRRSSSPVAGPVAEQAQQQQQVSSMSHPVAGGGGRPQGRTRVQRLRQGARSEGGPLRSLTTGGGGISRSALSADNSGVNGSVGGALQATATAPDRAFRQYAQRFNNSSRYKMLVTMKAAPSKKANPLLRTASGAAGNAHTSGKAPAGSAPTSTAQPSAATARASKRIEANKAVPATPQDGAKTGGKGTARDGTGAGEVTSPGAFVFSPPQAENKEERVDFVVPDTNVNVRMTRQRTMGASQLALFFDAPGAILTNTQEGDAVEGGLGAVAVAMPTQGTWVQAAMVPKGGPKAGAAAVAPMQEAVADAGDGGVVPMDLEPADPAEPQQNAQQDKQGMTFDEMYACFKSALRCGYATCGKANGGCTNCRPKARQVLMDAGRQDLIDQLSCQDAACLKSKYGCTKCWKALAATMREMSKGIQPPTTEPAFTAPDAAAPIVQEPEPAVQEEASPVPVPPSPEVDQADKEVIAPTPVEEPAPAMDIDTSAAPAPAPEAIAAPVTNIEYDHDRDTMMTMATAATCTVGTKRPARSSLGKTPGKKKRMASMLGMARTPKTRAPPTSPPVTRPAYLLKDESSPCKPGTASCYENEWGIEVQDQAPEQHQEHGETVGEVAPVRITRAQKQQQQKQDGDVRQDSSCGDGPVPASTVKCLPRLDASPAADVDSDEEDAAMLAIAAKGGLSPPGSADDKVEEMQQPQAPAAAEPVVPRTTVAANAGMLETTPATTKPQTLKAAADGNPGVGEPAQLQQQRRISEAVKAKDGAPVDINLHYKAIPFPNDEFHQYMHNGQSSMVVRFKVKSIERVSIWGFANWAVDLLCVPLDIPNVLNMLVHVESKFQRCQGQLTEPCHWSYIKVAPSKPSNSPPLPQVSARRAGAGSGLARQQQQRRDSISSGQILPLTEDVETARRGRKLEGREPLKPQKLSFDNPVPSEERRVRVCKPKEMQAQLLSPAAVAQSKQMLGNLYRE